MKGAEVSNLDSFSRIDVVAQILESAYRSSVIERTRISSELSSSQTQEYLSLMTKNELLKYDAASKTFKVTRKGEGFLRTYRQMGEFIDLIQEEIGL